MTFDRFDTVLNKVTTRVSEKYRLSQVTAEDFASRGIEYSFRYFIEKKIEEDWNEKDLFSLAYWKACNLVKDGYRRHDVLSDALSLDEAQESEEGELVESTLVSRAAFGKWRDDETKKTWHGLGRRAYARLEVMFEELGLSQLRREVFRKVYLEGCPVTQVCARLGITPNYAYGIVFGVKKGLAKVGPAILAAA